MGMSRVVAFVAFLLCCLQPAAAGDGPQQAPCLQADTACIALNPAVTPETIANTICAPGYTKRVRRKAQSYLTTIRRKLGVGGEMVLDHIIPLELGGHPSDESNLQPQERAESKLKDNVEQWLNALVCSGLAHLDDARAAIAKDWRSAEQQFEVLHRERGL